MLLPVLFWLFITLSVINMLHMGLYLVGANIYDTKQLVRNYRRSKRSRLEKPLVSVLIPAFNEEKVIERCLRSVWNNSYPNIEIIVINDGSSDKTTKIVQQYIAKRGKKGRRSNTKVIKSRNNLLKTWLRNGIAIKSRQLTLVKQRNGGKASALNNGIINYAQADLIMTLDADSMLHKNAIAKSLPYFSDPKVAGVAANVRIIEEPSVIGILQRFEHMVSYRSKKFLSVANCEVIVGGVASTYRKSVLKQVGYYDTDTSTEDIGLSMKIAALGNKNHQLVYAADVVAMTEGVRTYKALLQQRYRWKLGNLQNVVKHRNLIFAKGSQFTKSLTWYRAPMAIIGEFFLLLEPIALGYVIYVSLHFLTAALFIGAYMTITAYIMLVIWPDEHLSIKGKIKSSALAPLLYFIFYLMNIVQLMAAIRCIFNTKKIINLAEAESTWTSPERAGGTAVVS